MDDELVLPYKIIESPPWDTGVYRTIGWYMNLDGVEYGNRVLAINGPLDDNYRRLIRSSVRRAMVSRINNQNAIKEAERRAVAVYKAERKARKKIKKGRTKL